MHAYQQEFIALALELGALRFGEFKLKSGRISPYFFNAGLFNTGRAAARLGRAYAAAVSQSGIGFDMLFGPAYKGIPLVALTAACACSSGGDIAPAATIASRPPISITVITPANVTDSRTPTAAISPIAITTAAMIAA